MINHWFEPLTTSSLSFFNMSFTDANNPPSLDRTDVVFVFPDTPFAAAVRSALGKLGSHFPHLSTVDLGILRNDEPSFILEAIKDFIDSGITPIIVGTPKDTIDAMLNYVNQLKNLENLCYIGNRIWELDNLDCLINNIGYQRHLISPSHLASLENPNIQSIGLGKIRNKNSCLEPVLRDTEMGILDLSCLRASEGRSIDTTEPAGLYIEEVCHIMEYMGASPLIRSLIISNEGIDLKQNNSADNSAELTATAIWYFLEGINNNIPDHPKMNSDHRSYIVEKEEFDLHLTFLKSNRTNRWWLKDTSGEEPRFISCSYEEYQETISSEFPERLLKRLLV